MRIKTQKRPNNKSIVMTLLYSSLTQVQYQTLGHSAISFQLFILHTSFRKQLIPPPGRRYTRTIDQSIHFTTSSRNSPRQHTNWDHSKGLLLQPSVDCRVPGVIESVFECSGPNLNSTVTLTRSIQWKNSLTSPFFIQLCSSARFGQWRLQYWLLLRKLLLKEYNHKDKWYRAQCRAQRLLSSTKKH